MRIYLRFLILTITIFFLSSCILTEPNKPSSITGKVTNSAGVGLADVTVQVDSTTDNQSVTTASDGTYKLDFHAGGVCKLLFGKVGYTVQEQVLAHRGGETQTVNVVLRTLAEDAYFRVNLNNPDLSYPNTGGALSFTISTNVLYDFQCSSDWVSCIKTANSFSFTVSGNDTFAERTAIVKLNPQYGKSYTITIKQFAGPYLALLDYIGKDNQTNFLTSEPFITFNRPVTLKSVSCTETQADLTVRYSSDRKTIYFPNLKISPISFVSVNYTVQSDENMVVSSSFSLKLFINSQNVAVYRDMVYSKDNQYLWLLTDTELIQYNAANLTEVKRIKIPDEFWTDTQLFYNPFNNSLYIIHRSTIENRYYNDVRIYNAATGNYSGQVKIDDGGKLISALAFDTNGFGLMVFGGKLYYFDSANNNAMGIFSDQTLLYDPTQSTKLLVSKVSTCNAFKNLVLDGASSSGSKYVFTADIAQKTVRQVYTGTENALAAVQFSSGFFLFTNTANSLSYFDMNTNKKTTLLTNNQIKFLGVIGSDTDIPAALTNNLSFVSLMNGTENKYSLGVNSGNSIVDIKTTNNGKLIAILINSKLYLISSDLFGLYSSKLK